MASVEPKNVEGALAPHTQWFLDGQVLTIRFHNPGRRNAFTPSMRREAYRLLAEAQNGAGIRVVVLEGEGGHFSSGADLSGLGGANFHPGPDEVHSRLVEVLSFYRLVAEGRLPVIAKVNGDAFGAGCSLALACDLVIATPQSRFGMAFGQRGLLPDMGMMRSLAQRIGPHRAKRMLLFSEVLAGSEAYEAGLADMLVDPCDIDRICAERAGILARNAPIPTAGIKQAFGSGLSSCLDITEAELTLAVPISQSSDFQEGLSAFREKRPAIFSGT